jgi:hypothetical protein
VPRGVNGTGFGYGEGKVALQDKDPRNYPGLGAGQCRETSEVECKVETG